MPVHGRGFAGLAVIDRGLCAIVANGAVRCWSDPSKPLDVPGAPPMEELGASDDAIFGRARDGGVYLLYSGLHAQTSPAVRLAGADGARRIAASGATLCALRDGGQVTCFAVEGRGQSLVAPKASATIGVIADAIDVTVSASAICVLTASGEADCVGELARGVLGEGSFAATTLTRVEALHPLESLHLGHSSACMRTREGDQACSLAVLAPLAPWRDVGAFPRVVRGA